MLENKLYLVEHSDLMNNGVSYIIRQNKNNPIYKGHFPSTPITPGACLIEIAKELCEKYLERPLQVKSLKLAKFMSLIMPTQQEFLTVQIVVDYVEAEVNAKVHILSDNTVCSKINFTLV